MPTPIPGAFPTSPLFTPRDPADLAALADAALAAVEAEAGCPVAVRCRSPLVPGGAFRLVRRRTGRPGELTPDELAEIAGLGKRLGAVLVEVEPDADTLPQANQGEPGPLPDPGPPDAHDLRELAEADPFRRHHRTFAALLAAAWGVKGCEVEQWEQEFHAAFTARDAAAVKSLFRTLHGSQTSRRAKGPTARR